jgi:hypothetical protein
VLEYMGRICSIIYVLEEDVKGRVGGILLLKWEFFLAINNLGASLSESNGQMGCAREGKRIRPYVLCQ